MPSSRYKPIGSRYRGHSERSVTAGAGGGGPPRRPPGEGEEQQRDGEHDRHERGQPASVNGVSRPSDRATSRHPTNRARCPPARRRAARPGPTSSTARARPGEPAPVHARAPSAPRGPATAPNRRDRSVGRGRQREQRDGDRERDGEDGEPGKRLHRPGRDGGHQHRQRELPRGARRPPASRSAPSSNWTSRTWTPDSASWRASCEWISIDRPGSGRRPSTPPVRCPRPPAPPGPRRTGAPPGPGRRSPGRGHGPAMPPGPPRRPPRVGDHPGAVG